MIESEIAAQVNWHAATARRALSQPNAAIVAAPFVVGCQHYNRLGD